MTTDEVLAALDERLLAGADRIRAQVDVQVAELVAHTDELRHMLDQFEGLDRE